jgi:hypothetical protein
MTIAYHYNKARVFEVVLYGPVDQEDLKPPFLVRSRRSSWEHQVSLTPAYIRTVFKLVQEAQQCIRTFLGMNLEAIRAAPVMHYIRCFYCLTILLNLRTLCQNADFGIGSILEPDTLQIEDFLLKWHEVCTRAAGSQKCRSPVKFGLVLAKIQNWLREEISQDVGEDHEDLRPLMLLSAKQPIASIRPGFQQNEPLEEGDHHDESLAPDMNFAAQSTDMAEWTRPPFSVTAEQDPNLGFSLLHTPSLGEDPGTGTQWMEFPLSGFFVPMELDQNAVALIEGMSSDVAHSTITTANQFVVDGTWDGMMYH